MDAGQLQCASEKSPGGKAHAETAVVVAALCRQFQKVGLHVYHAQNGH